MGKRKRRRSWACGGKRRFHSRHQAKEALKRIRYTDPTPGRKPVRYYECPLCKGWHLTGNP